MEKTELRVCMSSHKYIVNVFLTQRESLWRRVSRDFSTLEARCDLRRYNEVQGLVRAVQKCVGEWMEVVRRRRKDEEVRDEGREVRMLGWWIFIFLSVEVSRGQSEDVCPMWLLRTSSNWWTCHRCPAPIPNFSHLTFTELKVWDGFFSSPSCWQVQYEATACASVCLSHQVEGLKCHPVHL